MSRRPEPRSARARTASGSWCGTVIDPVTTRPPRASPGRPPRTDQAGSTRDRRGADPGRRASRSGAAPAAEPADAPADDPRVAELTAEVAERTADLQRLSAEYANYRRRVDRDREAVLVNARAQFVGELLTVLDDVERAGDARRPARPVQVGRRQARVRGAEARPRAVRHRGRAVRPVGARGRAARDRPTPPDPRSRCCPRSCAAATASATACCGRRWWAWSTGRTTGPRRRPRRRGSRSSTDATES